jgi:uncharacterized membrane protein YgcG
MINNPGYQGKWKPARIPNPDYFEDAEPWKMTPIAGLALELWSMSDSIYFDNFLITDSIVLAEAFARETFDLKQAADASVNGNIFRRLLDYSNKNPWLYAVYVVLVGLPTVLVITFCCSGDKADKSGEAGAGRIEVSKQLTLVCYRLQVFPQRSEEDGRAPGGRRRRGGGWRGGGRGRGGRGRRGR